MNQSNQFSQVIELLKGAQRILIAPSTPMDGDSIGSAISLMLILKKMGKDVVIVAKEECPDALKFLPYIDQIESELVTSKDFIISLSTLKTEVDHMKYEVEPDKINIIVSPKNGNFTQSDVTFPSEADMRAFDLIITVDTGDLVQLGTLYEDNKRMFESVPLLNIDHHSSNSKFGTTNVVDALVAATTQILLGLFLELESLSGERIIDEDIATLLLTGIITDTGSFQHSNTSPDAFEAAAELLDRGARQQEIIKHVFKTKSLATLKLWGRVLSKIQYDDVSRFVYSTITQQDLQDTGAESNDSGGIIDELMSNAPKAEVVLLLKEKEPGFVSGSLRAPNDIADVSEIAARMGGGGHKKAAGFRIREKSMDEALEIAKKTISEYMAEKLSPEGTKKPQITHKLFPNLIVKPNASIPAPSEGGEDMLLEHFKKQQTTPEKDPIEEKAVHFFQDKDGQAPVAPGATEAPQTPPQEPTVGDVLNQLEKNRT
ncbi:DHH family phosphoesterase [Patescibacteria group bacterium]|nr:DHH family phosphoesterase [Patescibacteria group bacterium]